ncbi:MAG: DEAD/DEAH box helicase [Bdellovibrionaceae bacterium]|nr:DEAD/DEAH box helicase [Pseudobdellovibrionaceae bacterium]
MVCYPAMDTYENNILSLSFESSQINPLLIESLKNLQITIPTEIQVKSIPAILQKKNTLAVAQTGTGKTLAYLLPLLTLLAQNKDQRALILSPSRETTEQIHKVMLSVSEGLLISSCLVTSGTPVATQSSQLKKNPRLIVATPGRIGEHLNNNKLLLKGLSYIVIDEADRLLATGFQTQFEFIRSTLRGTWQTIMFAATTNTKVEEVAKKLLGEDFTVIKAQNVHKPVETLKQKIYFMSLSQKNNRLLDEVKKRKASTIIFADSKESCVAIGRLLTHHQLSCDFVHGDMNPGHRNRIFREFREQKIQILITTDLMARGLDFPNVAYVINFELPYKAEDFLHRIGRTARAGKEGVAITFITPSDYHGYKKIKSYLKDAEEETIATNFKFDVNE